MAAALSSLCPHCALPAPQPRDLASKGSHRPTSLSIWEAGKLLFFLKKKYIYFLNQSTKARKGRGGADLGHCPRGLAGMDEWMDSFQAALQLSVCVMGRGPQGQQSCCHQPSPALPGGPGGHSLPVTLCSSCAHPIPAAPHLPEGMGALPSRHFPRPAADFKPFEFSFLQRSQRSLPVWECCAQEYMDIYEYMDIKG